MRRRWQIFLPAPEGFDLQILMGAAAMALARGPPVHVTKVEDLPETRTTRREQFVERMQKAQCIEVAEVGSRGGVCREFAMKEHDHATSMTERIRDIRSIACSGEGEISRAPDCNIPRGNAMTMAAGRDAPVSPFRKQSISILPCFQRIAVARVSMGFFRHGARSGAPEIPAPAHIRRERGTCDRLLSRLRWLAVWPAQRRRSPIIGGIESLDISDQAFRLS